MKRIMRLFENKYGSESIIAIKEDGSCWADSDEDYFPVSLPFEVDVTMMPADEVTENRIDSLECAKKEAHAKWLTIAAAFDDRIAKLRAIPHLEEES